MRAAISCDLCYSRACAYMGDAARMSARRFGLPFFEGLGSGSVLCRSLGEHPCRA
jgi:hypothetical protein